MKICILTQPLAQNYGGIMQCYALEQVLIRMGHEPVAVDWIHPSPIRKCLSCIKQFLLHMLGKKKGKLRSWMTEKEKNFLFHDNLQFIRKELCMTEPMIATKRMSKLKLFHFNGFIVGSDQVWTPSSSPRIKTFFLDFTERMPNVRRIAYAASYGGHWVKKKSLDSSIKHYARQFDALSCREESASKTFAEKWETDVQTVLDPTFLLKKTDYVDLLKLSTKKCSNVFGYFLDYRAENDRILNAIAENYGCSADSICVETMIKNNSPLYSPRNWLSNIGNSKFVVTDSFHGMVFSLIFEKDFIVILNEKRGKNRFLDILNAIGLSERGVISGDEVNVDLINKHIDYSNANAKLDKLRRESLEFLSEALR